MLWTWSCHTFVFDIWGNLLNILTPTDPVEEYGFGWSVHVSNEAVIVGRPGKSFDDTHVGSAYIYQ